MKTIFVGNGVNRFTPGYSWSDVVQALATACGVASPASDSSTPFTLLYEQMILCSHQLAGQEDEAKKEVSRLLGSLRPNEYHEQIARLGVNHVLTTNYDYTLEMGSGHTRREAHTGSESRYSLFRSYLAGSTRFWHLHGEADKPATITLGHDQYVGYLTKTKNYLTSTRTRKQNGKYDHRSPFIAGVYDVESSKIPFSWVDVFLRDDVHIVGFGLDFSEIGLWWLLTYKRRLALGHPRTPKSIPVGSTTYYLTYSEKLTPSELSKSELLRQIGVSVVALDCGPQYRNSRFAYDRILRAIAAA